MRRRRSRGRKMFSKRFKLRRRRGVSGLRVGWRM